jgi:3-phenylpropionate/cinnamic acid dioxygenase small subunit
MRPKPEDHVAIVDLLARYCLALDLDDVESWVALFTPDVRYEVYGRSRSAVYTDELHRTDDGWRIAHTRCRFIVADGLADRPAD